MAVHGRLEGRHRDSIRIQLEFLTIADGLVHFASAAAGTIAMSNSLIGNATTLGVQIQSSRVSGSIGESVERRVELLGAGWNYRAHEAADSLGLPRVMKPIACTQVAATVGRLYASIQSPSQQIVDVAADIIREVIAAAQVA